MFSLSFALVSLLALTQVQAKGGHGSSCQPVGWVAEPQCGLGAFHSDASRMEVIKNDIYHFFGFSFECFEASVCENSYFDANIYKYDINKNKWSLLTTTAGDQSDGLPGERVFFGSTTFKQNSQSNIAIYGGVNYNAAFTQITLYDDLWYYSVNDNTWNLIKPIDNGVSPGLKAGAQIVASDEYIYLFGGANQFFQTVNEFYRYSFADNAWTSIVTADGVYPGARYIFPMLYNPDEGAQGEIIVTTGGSNTVGEGVGDLWFYDIDDNIWSQVSSTLSGRTHCGAALDKDGNVFVFFGDDAENNGTECKTQTLSAGHKPISETFVYVRDDDEWIKLNDQFSLVPPTVKRHAFTQTKNKAYVMGGFDFACQSEFIGGPVRLEQLYSFDLNQFKF